MLQNAWSLKGYSIQATDGKIGHVDDFYFDDITWAVRYVVVDTGTWLSGREVLLSPVAITGISEDERSVNLAFTCDYVSGAPDAESERPVTRRWEAEYHDYFGWPYYWEGAGLYGTGPYPGFATNVENSSTEESSTEEEESHKTTEKGDRHLQSARDVGDCRIAASNGEIGHVVDYVIDEDSWVIRYVQVDTGNWLPGKKVLISTRLITAIDWQSGSLKISLPREVIEHAPPYDPDQSLERDYEQGMFDYYQKNIGHTIKPYWELEQ